MNKKNYILLFVIILFLLPHMDIEAQCAMCRTTAESDLKNGGVVGKGLNNAILYLMAIPYLVLMTGAYFFFKKPIDAKLRALKSKYLQVKQ